MIEIIGAVIFGLAMAVSVWGLYRSSTLPIGQLGRRFLDEAGIKNWYVLGTTWAINNCAINPKTWKLRTADEWEAYLRKRFPDDLPS